MPRPVVTRRPVARALRARLEGIRLFLCDVDGILTDATVFMGAQGEFKPWHIRDGLGLRLLQQHGVRVGWVSARPSPATTARAADLRVDFLHQASGSKVAAIEALLAKAGCSWAETSYMGDDIIDLGALRRAGVAFTVPEAVAEARAAAHHVTRAGGGRGAVREAAELILKAQGKWEGILQKHLE